MTIRERMEQREHEYLNPKAAFSDRTEGRDTEEEKCDIRPEYQRDRDRILHSKAFRRLKGKTQVFLAPEGDHYRTRLTHTLEVSQNARTIAKALRLNEDLTEAIALGHDLGHTPFGHAGERALNRVCEGGFEHHIQSIRVVERLEKHGKGLNLTKEVRDGILNHQTKGRPSTMEGKIVRLSDKIAYINHDIQDALRANIIKVDDMPDKSLYYFSASNRIRLTKLITDIIENSYDKDVVAMSDECFEQFVILRDWLFAHVYTNSPAKMEEEKAKNVVKMLFEYYCAELEKTYPKSSKENILQTACDYISGMTDRYVLIKYEENFLPAPLIQKNRDEFLYKLAQMNGLK